MGAAPRFADLPAEIAIFPLAGALLLPHGRLPLNIFEPRYLAMVEDALGAGRLFGMIQPDPALPEGPAGPGLYHIGCLGRIASFSETDDGRYLISLAGMVRFRVAQEQAPRRGYRVVRAAYDGFADDLAPPDAGGVSRAALLGALAGYFTARGLEANQDTLRQMPDAMLPLTLAMACPFDPAEKQALLEAPTPAARAATLLALLQMGSHERDDDAHRNVS